MDNIPQGLHEAINSKQLIPIVGAGVSKSIKNKQGEGVFPSWIELLEKAANELKKQAENNKARLVESFLKEPDFQQAAKYAYEGLKGPNWYNFFKSQFFPEFDTLDSGSASLPKAIWQLSNQIITLNYDKTLEWAHKQPAEVSTIDNNSTAELADFQKFNHDKPVVWHLHGHIDNSAELILTPNGYQKLYATSADTKVHYKAALETLKTVSRNKSFLFIGCSLDDAELLFEIHQEQNLFAENTGPHYALVHKDEKAKIKAKLNGANIKLIPFDDFGDPLVKLIEDLASHAPQKSTPIIEAQPLSQPHINHKKIALLSANPLDQIQNDLEKDRYTNLLKEFKKIPCSIDHFSLSVENLNNLHDYDYVLILSKVIKDKLLIENEYLCSRNISFTELEEQIGNKSVSGIFILVDQLPNETSISALRLPTLILPKLEKSELANLTFQLFKRNNLKYFKNAQVLNPEAFSLSPLTEKTNTHFHQKKTALPGNIDPKTVRNFIGRTNDLEQICQKLLSLEDQSGILTIKGSGGIGKTTIIKKLTVALAERGYFEGGINFVDGEFITDCQQLINKVVSAFNLEQAEDAQQHLREHHDHLPRLIIIDNLETLLYLDDTQQIKTFLSFICDYATLVVTSRETLLIEGEVIYEMRQFTTDEAFELFTSGIEQRKIAADEVALLRQDIIENLLDNNPLAIKLITGNMPKGKSLRALKEELETNLFSKISETELELFDDKSDLNISRKKSIYGSILFSYNHLTEEEKIAFEVLSLFPDGIDLETFKRLSNEQKKSASPHKSMITDKIIKSLENKSMLENNSGQIKLQSIVGKFAEVQLHQRDNLTQYYQHAFERNRLLVESLVRYRKENKNHALRIFNSQQGNFLKSISYCNQVALDASELLIFFRQLETLFANICSLKGFIHELSIRSIDFDSMDRLSVKSLLLHARYFDGDFKNSFDELKQLVPLELISSLDRSKNNEEMLVDTALSIYLMEGEALYAAKYRLENNIFLDDYPTFLLPLGVFHQQLAENYRNSFFSLEVRANLGLLSYKEIDNYMAKLYDKGHIERMQVSYIRSKIIPLDLEKIEKLVIVNPYTRGLKNLMLAFIEQDVPTSNELYQQAINQLEHIKYYYVEALYFYAKFLQEQGQDEFENIYKKGLALAQKHHYRFLQYRFEQLINPTGNPYSPQDYPLPNNEDFTGYIQKLINQRKHEKN
ncbi:MAG: SIR2 family protein [Methylococcaceae bacterium]